MRAYVWHKKQRAKQCLTRWDLGSTDTRASTPPVSDPPSPRVKPIHISIRMSASVAMTEKLHFLVMLGPLMPKEGVGIEMPVRKVVQRSSVRTRGYFPSYKVGRPVAWESSLELRCIWFLEYSTAVKSYEEQPLVVDYIGADGKAAKTTPDFLVHLKRGGPLLIEVKPERKLKEKESAVRFDCIADAAAAAGYR